MMPFLRFWWYLLLFAVAVAYGPSCQSFCRAQELKELNGRITFVSPAGVVTPLTATDSFSQASLSPDGKWAVFLRNSGVVEDPIAPWPKAKTQKTQIWIADTMVANSARVVYSGPVRRGDHQFYSFDSPRLSPDDRYVYFLIREAVVTSGLLRLELSSNKVDYLTTALNFQVVPNGKYRGDLVVQIRKPTLSTSFYEWYWLLGPDGKEIGLVGQDEGAVALFLEQQQ